MNVPRQWCMVGAVVVQLAVTLIHPLYPKEQLLHHVPTAVAIAGLAWLIHRRVMSELSMFCMCLFLAIHVLGARYTYSFVPYDRWTEAIAGFNLTDAFGWKRNHYDRLVHLMFGVLGMVPLFELFRGRLPLKRGWAIFCGISVIIAASAVYEVFEWLVTLLFSPEQADNYNGQQGDVWDAQKDIALGALGAMFTSLFERPRSKLQ